MELINLNKTLPDDLLDLNTDNNYLICKENTYVKNFIKLNLKFLN